MIEVERITQPEAARRLGCSLITVARRCAKLKLHTRSNGMPGAQNCRWKGGITRRPDGYTLKHAPDHPHRSKGPYVYLHRLVVEESLGRYLAPGEVVHHIDHDPSNNSLRNLLVFQSQADHIKHHRSMDR